MSAIMEGMRDKESEIWLNMYTYAKYGCLVNAVWSDVI